MAIIISVIILVLLIVVLALLPIRIGIDTGQEVFCHVVIGGIFQCKGEASEKGWFLTFQFLVFRKKINLLAAKKASAKKKQKQKVKKGSIKFPSPIRLLKAFRLQKLEWLLDTGDFLQNAQLYPLFQVLSRGPVVLSVNFNGQNIFILKAYTRIYLLAAALLKS